RSGCMISRYASATGKPGRAVCTFRFSRSNGSAHRGSRAPWANRMRPVTRRLCGTGLLETIHPAPSQSTPVRSSATPWRRSPVIPCQFRSPAMPAGDARNPGGVAGIHEATINRVARIVRWSALAIVAVMLLLIFGVPRRPPPPPSPAQPEQAVVDRVGLVSPAWARQTAGALLNDPRAEIVVYIDARPPDGNLEPWTV